MKMVSTSNLLLCGFVLLGQMLSISTAFQGKMFHLSGLRTASSLQTRIRVSSTASTSDSSAAVKFEKPDRVVLDDLPVVYVYDHCPFCVRVRVALGLKNIKHTVHFMANDDIPTPTKLVGKKIAPIFSLPQDNLIMPESMDIINFVESDERFGPTNKLLPATGRTDIKAWQKSVQELLRTLQRPRYVATGLMPEFQQLDGRHAFIKNHQLPPYSKQEWKNTSTEEGGKVMPMEEKLKLYAEAMASDPTALLEELNMKLVELDDICVSEHHCSEGGLSLDDVDLFSRLRSITIIKGVKWPTKLRSYMDNMSELADVPLYDEMAL